MQAAERDFLALVRIVAYIKATRELGIHFRNTFEVQKMVKLCCWMPPMPRMQTRRAILVIVFLYRMISMETLFD
jgi:hypothetical protein